MGKNTKKSSEKTVTKTETRWRRIPNQVKSKLHPLTSKLLSRCTDVSSASAKKTVQGYKDLYELLQDIQKIEKDYVPPTSNREENLEGFLTWCKDQGAEFDSISVKEVSGSYYGMVAETDLKEAEKFLTVPRKMMLSVEDAISSKLGPLIKEDKLLQCMPNVALSLFLIMETLDKNSFWAPYISILPSKYDTVLYYSLEELELLQRSPIIEKVVNTCQSVARQYAYFSLVFQRNELAKSLDIGPFFTYDLYRWAVSTVMTRQNGVRCKEGTSDTTALIPLWDMCNHSNGKFSTDFIMTTDCLESYAMKDFNCGDEVFIYYGPRSNADFFIHNAFVYPSNENDFVELKLTISKSDPLASQKTDLCQKKNIASHRVFNLPKGGAIDDELLMFLKIYVMKEDEVNEASADDSLFDETTEKGKDIKLRALTFLKDRSKLLILSYGTNVEEDEALLKNTIQQRSRMAIMLRICEKKILNDCLCYCEESLKT